MTILPAILDWRDAVPRWLRVMRALFVWMLVTGYSLSAVGVPGFCLLNAAGGEKPGCHCSPALKLAGKCCCNRPAETKSCCSKTAVATRSCCSAKSSGVASKGAKGPQISAPDGKCGCRPAPEVAVASLYAPAMLPQVTRLPKNIDDAGRVVTAASLIAAQAAPTPEGPPPRAV
jgi:hypothetical protein